MVPLARSTLSRKSLHHRGCVTRKNKASLPSSSIRASVQGATSLRPSQWVRRPFSVSWGFTYVGVLKLTWRWALVSWSVVVGRPVMYGLVLGGEQGVEEVLRGLLAETEITLGLSGHKNLDEIWGMREAVLEKGDTPHRCSSTKQ
jgi:hypothetical protein